MLGRLKLSVKHTEKVYCELFQKLYKRSQVRAEVFTHLIDTDEPPDTSYDLVREIRDLVQKKPEFSTDLPDVLTHLLADREDRDFQQWLKKESLQLGQDENLQDPALDDVKCRV